jgi:hypothetical protein
MAASEVGDVSGHIAVRRVDQTGCLMREATMRPQDLIDLFLEDEDGVERPYDDDVAREREDTSSVADIVRILRELDGQYDTERDSR